MTEQEIKDYILGFVKEAADQGLSQKQAVELIIKLANDTEIEYPEDQLVDIS